MFGDIIQPTHLIFILVVALIVLGPKRLPEVGRSLGRGLRDFRQGMQGVEAEARGVFRDATDEPDSRRWWRRILGTGHAGDAGICRRARRPDRPLRAGPHACRQAQLQWRRQSPPSRIRPTTQTDG